MSEEQDINAVGQTLRMAGSVSVIECYNRIMVRLRDAESRAKIARREAIEEAFLAANHMQASFLTFDVDGLENLPSPTDDVQWLLRMANEMTGAIRALLEKE